MRIDLALALAAVALATPTADAAAETSAFVPEADTYVDSSKPSASFGSSQSMAVDAKPKRRAYLRFRVTGLAGRQISGARLRLYSTEASKSGGEVWSISSTDWTESMTWKTRPAIDGTRRASFGAISAGQDYDVDVTGAVTENGVVSLAIQSPSSDRVAWATRESGHPPKLLVDSEVPVVPGEVSTVADSSTGSSDPTYFAAQHRLAVTSGGRLLTVFGRHLSGVQLAWRDRRDDWQTDTTGATGNGGLLTGTNTGDWPASIAVARDTAGAEHAWVVWSGVGYTKQRSLQMVRLSDLDSPSGPTVGPTVTLDPAPLGAYRPDLSVQTGPDGSRRLSVVWSRRAGDTTFQVVAGWVTDLDSDEPSVASTSTLYDGGSASRFATTEPTSDGTAVLLKGPGDALRLARHTAGDPLDSWTVGTASGVPVGSGGSPAAVALASGELLSAVETDTNSNSVAVQRWAADGTPADAELSLIGYAQPTLATDGVRAWLVMIRKSDGYVVSRELTPGSGWSSSDRVELDSSSGGDYAWPNALRRSQLGLRLVVQGPVGPTADQHAVLAFDRPL